MKINNCTKEELQSMQAEFLKDLEKIPEKIGKLIEREKTLNDRAKIIDDLLQIKEYE